MARRSVLPLITTRFGVRSTTACQSSLNQCPICSGSISSLRERIVTQRAVVAWRESFQRVEVFVAKIRHVDARPAPVNMVVMATSRISGNG